MRNNSQKIEKKVAMITMDVEDPDVYSQESMDQFLEILDEFNFKATFFVTYSITEKFPDIIKRLIEKGHEVGSHGYSHSALGDTNYFFLPEQSAVEIEGEIKKSKLFLKKFNIEPQGIRLPALKWNKEVLNVISKYFKYDCSVASSYLGKTSELSNFNPEKLINKKLIELPISRINRFNIRLGTPVFFRIGAKNMIRLIKKFGVSLPLLFYSHSFDLVNMDVSKIATEKWKKRWYFEQCSPQKADFFRTFFKYLKDENFEVVKCIDFINSLNHEKNRYA